MAISVTTTQKIIFVLKRKPGIIPILSCPLLPYTIFLLKIQKLTTAIRKTVRKRSVDSTSKQMERTINEV
jgi:hypothetical protein